MSKDLLIEIGTEEIPAGFLPPALSKWREAVVRLLRRFWTACRFIINLACMSK